MVHWLELALNGGDFFAAVLLTPELLRAKREAVADRFVENVSAWAKMGLWVVPIIGLVFALFASDMSNHIKAYVANRNFDGLYQYSYVLAFLLVIYAFVVGASFMNQYLNYAKKVGKEQIFLAPGLTVFLVIRAISIALACGW